VLSVTIQLIQNSIPFTQSLITASQEKQGRTTEFLQGSIKFGRDINNPDFNYKVDNGTLLVDPDPHVLTLKGVRG
jgi:hypothetical protein